LSMSWLKYKNAIILSFLFMITTIFVNASIAGHNYHVYSRSIEP